MADTDSHELQVVQTDVSFHHEVQYQFSVPNVSLERWDFTQDFKTTCPILPTDWRLKVSFRKDPEAVACIINIKRLDSRECLVRGKFDLDLFCVSGSDSWRICRPIHFEIPGMISGQEMAQTLLPVLSLNRMNSFSDGNLFVEARLRINGCCYWTAHNILDSQKADVSSSFNSGDQRGKVCTTLKNLPSKVAENIKEEEKADVSSSLNLGDQRGKVCTLLKNLPSNLAENISVEQLIKFGTALLRFNKANGTASVLQLMGELLKSGIKLLGSKDMNNEATSSIAQFVDELIKFGIDLLRSNNANTNETAEVTPSKL